MGKGRFRNSIKSIFGSQEEKIDELEGAKIEVEDNVNKILTLIKDEDNEEKDSDSVSASKRERVAELVQDFQKQYLSLYSRYDGLTGELRKKFRSKKEKDSSSSSSSDSDSDDSSKGKSSKNGKLEGELQKIINDIKQELEVAHQEVVDLKGGAEALSVERTNLLIEKKDLNERIVEGEKITAEFKSTVDRLNEEKLTLQKELEAVREEFSNLKQQLQSAEQQVSDLSKALKHKEEENTSLTLKISDLSNEIQQSQTTVQDLLADSGQLKDKLGVREREYTTLSELHEAHGTETSARIKEFDVQVTALQLELEALQGHKRDREVQIESKDVEVKQLRDENAGLQAQIQQAQETIHGHLTESSQLKETLGVKEREYSTLYEKHETHGTETSVQIKELEEQVSGLKLDLESLQGQKSDLEMQIGTKETEASQLREETAALQVQISKLSNEIQEARDAIEGHLAESSQLKETLGVKEREYVSLSEKHEAHGTETSTRILEFEAQLTGLKLELESLQGHKSNIETQLTSKETEARQLRDENIALLAQIEHAQQTIKGHLDESSELKETLGVKEREYFTLSKRHEAHGTETTAQIKEFEAQVMGLKLELESLMGQKSDVEKQLESKEIEATQLKEENTTLQAQISQISDEIQQAHVAINGHQSESSQLKETLSVKEREYFSLSERHETHGAETSTRIKEFEAQVTSLALELESVRAEKRDMEVKIESKDVEATQLGEKVTALQSQITTLESMSKEREEELSALMKKLEDHNSESSSRITNLTTQVNNLLSDMDLLRAQKLELEEQIVSKGDEASIQVKGLVEQASTLQQEVESLHRHKAELEAEIDCKTREISEHLVLIQQLKEEITSKTLDQQRVLEEKEGVSAENKNLELKIESVQNQKNDLEEQIKSKDQENCQLKEEIAGLNAKVLELEKLLTTKETEFSTLQETLKSGENEASTRIIALTTQISNLQKEFDSLKTQKYEMQLQFESEKQELLENHKADLTTTVNDHQTVIREREDLHYRLNEEHKQVKSWFHHSKTDLEVAERKIEQMAEEFSEKINSKDQIIADFELISEELKRDLEVKEDELSTALDNVHNIEVKLRLSNQKLRITEQLLTEKEESFRKAEEKFLEEHKVLGDKITLLSKLLAGNKEAYEGMITEISKKLSNSLTELEVLISKFEDDYTSYTNSIHSASHEVRVAKSWVVEVNSNKHKLKKDASLLAEQLKGKREEELELRNRVEILEVKATKEGKEKDGLIKAVTLLEKKVLDLEKTMEEKNEGIVGLGEEKREAIRQLCLWIDYHQSRYDYLKDVLSKKTTTTRTVRSQRAV